MSRTSGIGHRSVRHVLLLCLACGTSVSAQYPAAKRKTSAAGTLRADAGNATAVTGNTRELICRGKPGLHLTTEQDSSPRNPRQVAVSLSYRRSSKPPGTSYEHLEPGSCTWNPGGYADVPAEPGIVRFDLDRNGSEAVPDPQSLPVYLGDPQHYWVFYVDDATNLSVSHGAYRGKFQAAKAFDGKKRRAHAALLQNVELRCRGGSGLAFSRGGSAGNNQIAMTLTYRVSQNPPGENGYGLNPGTCAWVDREGLRQEPGRIEFTTAGNAQLKQIQSGSAVDRGPRVAERWPDANTIPAYMNDWSHFWTFTVQAAAPETARTHRAWIPPAPPIALPSGNSPRDFTPQQPAVKDAARQPVSEIATTVAGSPSAGTSADTSRTAVSPPPASSTAAPSTPTASGVVGGLRDASPTLSMPAGGGGGERSPEANDFATSRVVRAPVTLVRVLADPVRNRLLITFTARPNASPAVVYSRREPVREPGSGRWFFPSGGYRMDVAAATAQAFRAEYRASSWIPGDRTETSYHYIITVPGAGDAAEEQLTGQFTVQARVPPPPSDGFKANAN
jgi:hypothetical protein